ncbi:hypothetical protein [Spirosoma endophyticum]|uniref:Uncharacterized protein n=1 Tax=Spirosoma endophyticum TaxID=662367 RepID=A0A1I1SMK7_9BACT|nr:hypothetical protein [Spirosoma endophyticum]SFD47631.1 hypothetical protein SAMN05216167_105161 [Spirosoma endophyticum]
MAIHAIAAFATFDDFTTDGVDVVAPFLMIHVLMEVTDHLCKEDWVSFRIGMN